MGVLPLLLLLVLLPAGCGPSEIEETVTVSGCALGAVRVMAFDEADACARERPGAEGDILFPDDDSGWLDPRFGPPTLRVPAEGPATVVALCRDEGAIVRQWGCDDDRADGFSIAALAVCAPCTSLFGLCPDGARAWRDYCVEECTCEESCGGVACETDEVCSHDRCVPGAEDGDGDGWDASTDCDDDDPAVVPGSTRACETACASGLETCAADREWGPCGAPTDCTCDPGETRSEPCGRCGAAGRTCAAGGEWGDVDACAGEGECAPGQQEPEACSQCGTRTRICEDDCTWGAFGACTDRGACSPGETESRSCGDCGTQTRTCDDACHWGGFGPCDADASACEAADPRPCSHWACETGTCTEVLEKAGTDPGLDCGGGECCDGAGACAPAECS